MSDIRINQIKGIQAQKTNKKEKEEKQSEAKVNQEAKVVKKEAREVLTFMAQSAALNKSVIKKKEIDTAKHVDSNSQERIEQMMKVFDETILQSAEVAIKEFGLSEKAGQDVAIMAFNQRFLV